MEGTTVTVVIALVGLGASVVKPIVALTRSITELTVVVKDLQQDVEQMREHSRQTHKKLWKHNSAQEGRNFAQYAAANGLGSGTAGQAALARSITLQNNPNDLTAQTNEQKACLAKADAEADLAKDLYEEKIRREKLDYDIRKYWYDNGITPVTAQNGQEDLTAIARQVIRCDWGNGAERRQKLTAAGYGYNAVQSLVDVMMAGE